MRLAIILAALVVFSGCKSSNPPAPAPYEHSSSEDGKVWTEQDQVCSMCGVRWKVTTLDGSRVEPTVAWCYHDGEYCEEGFDMLLEAARQKSASPVQERAFLDHCLGCKGCRCAAFNPGEWRAIMDTLEAVNRQDKLTDAELKEMAAHESQAGFGLSFYYAELRRRNNAQWASAELARRRSDQ